MLHDILCLANARSDKDRYIVFGINDECNSFCKTKFEIGAYREELEKYVNSVTDEDYKQNQNDLTLMLDNCSLNKNLFRYVHLYKFDLSPFWTSIRDSNGRFIEKERKLLILHIENVQLRIN